MTAPSTPNLSRRGFLRGSTAAGIAVKVSFLRGTAQARLADGAPRPGPGWIVGGKPRHRLDALAKVTGAKTFTRDYRARDLPGWPDTQAHAFLIAATKADRRFEGLDLSRLGQALQPDRLVLHEDLVADGLSVPPHPDFFGDRFLVPKGATPRLLGQPQAPSAPEQAGTFPNGAPKVLKPRSMPDAPGVTMPGPLDRRIPEGGVGSSGTVGMLMDRMHSAVDRMAEMSVRSHATIELVGPARNQVRVKGMLTKGDGPVRSNIGISMPQAETA